MYVAVVFILLLNRINSSNQCSTPLAVTSINSILVAVLLSALALIGSVHLLVVALHLSWTSWLCEQFEHTLCQLRHQFAQIGRHWIGPEEVVV